MNVDGRTVSRRADAAVLLARYAARIDVRSRQSEPLGELGGQPLDATVRRDLTSGQLFLQVRLRGLPVAAAEQPLVQARGDASSILRQLEARIRDLPDARQRITSRQQAANDEATAARTALRQPFKYTDELHAAAARCVEIAEEMTARQQADVDTSPVAGEPSVAPETAETAEIRRLLRAVSPTSSPRSTRVASTGDTSRPPARAPLPRSRPPERRSR
jgi:hypothetical protein